MSTILNQAVRDEAHVLSEQDHLLLASEVQRRADVEQWRREVASRVQRHRARRRRRFDPSASFEFDFPNDSALAIASTSPLPQAVRLDQQEHVEPAFSGNLLAAEAPPASRKIIRFPRHIEPDAPTPPYATEPLQVVRDSPRILDLPEPQQLELLPTFPDILLDDREDEDEEPKATPFSTGIDLPPHPAPLRQRIFSAMVDLAVLHLAGGLSAAVFFELAGGVPSGRQALPYALIVWGAFWCLLQYVFLVYGCRTPGMSAAGVELCSFGGQPANERARRVRAWSATLSAFSLGLGFFWVFVDEDTLGWHDRISETYLKSRARQ